jgi:hypothetical protein
MTQIIPIMQQAATPAKMTIHGNPECRPRSFVMSFSIESRPASGCFRWMGAEICEEISVPPFPGEKE